MSQCEIRLVRDLDRPILTSKRNTALSQRETLEAIMTNLAGVLGASEVHKRISSRGGKFYSPQDPLRLPYQSATNTILELSKIIASRP
jgi:hypothetical protein